MSKSTPPTFSSCLVSSTKTKLTFRHSFYYQRSIFSSSSSRQRHGKKVVDEHFSSYFSLTKLTLQGRLQGRPFLPVFAEVMAEEVVGSQLYGLLRGDQGEIDRST